MELSAELMEAERNKLLIRCYSPDIKNLRPGFATRLGVLKHGRPNSKTSETIGRPEEFRGQCSDENEAEGVQSAELELAERPDVLV